MQMRATVRHNTSLSVSVSVQQSAEDTLYFILDSILTNIVKKNVQYLFFLICSKKNQQKRQILDSFIDLNVELSRNYAAMTLFS